MNKTLIVIDMQNDFIDGALGSQEAQAILPQVKAKIEQRAAEGWEILYTRDTHGQEYLQTAEGKHLPVVHCIKDTHGWQIAAGLYREGCRVIDKPNFGWPHWDTVPLREVELIGVCTDICVVSNALLIKAQHPEIPVSVDAACCAGVTPQSHRAALQTMQMCQIQVTNL
jgi:nicotinamidase-related amidase